jgi:hypothetical protein
MNWSIEDQWHLSTVLTNTRSKADFVVIYGL